MRNLLLQKSTLTKVSEIPKITRKTLDNVENLPIETSEQWKWNSFQSQKNFIKQWKRKPNNNLEEIQSQILLHTAQINNLEEDLERINSFIITEAVTFHITKAKEQTQYLKSLQTENAGFLEDIHKRILESVLEKYETFCEQNQINCAKFLEILMEMAPNLYNESQIIKQKTI